MFIIASLHNFINFQYIFINNTSKPLTVSIIEYFLNKEFAKINYLLKYSTTHEPHNTIPLGRSKYFCPISTHFPKCGEVHLLRVFIS